MQKAIQDRLTALSEEKYRQFSSALIPGTSNMLGVRLPQIRALAKELVKEGNWREHLQPDHDLYFEELMLRGMLIGYRSMKDKNMELKEIISMMKAFIPQIHNWSVCDSFCTSMKIIRKNRDVFWEFLQPYLYSEKEFYVRTGYILLLNHFIKCDASGQKIHRKKCVTITDLSNPVPADGMYTEQIFSTLNRPFLQGYYAQMAVAWLIAELFVVYPTQTMQFLKSCPALDTFTYHKALQKICESHTPDDEVKVLIRKLKRK